MLSNTTRPIPILGNCYTYNAVLHPWPLKHKNRLIEHEWLNIEDKSKKHHFSTLEAYKYNPINSAVEKSA